MTNITEFEASQFLETPEDIADFLNDAIESGNADVISSALKEIGKTIRGSS